MDAVEDVKARLSVEDVIGEYVELKRAGRNFKGLSPWTSEKSPSLMVSPDKQIWHDFSSGKGGNIFSFVMELEGLDFKGALELLARKAGVDLEQYRQSGNRGPSKERLYAASEAATHFYQYQFSKSKIALEYALKKRQFSKATALDWRLGYSPSSGSALIDYLKSKKFTLDEIKRAGLTNSYGKDMFRGRLMIPLMDPQGRVIGFTARKLSEADNGPKYINTPATAIYDKSRHVFGLEHAKAAIRSSDYAVLAEGNLDVISSHQAGIKQVVATAGTALTVSHLKLLARFTSDIRLSFDADRAGLAATERAIPLASQAGLSLNIITIAEGKDPDELVKKDPKLWVQVVEKPKYALDWLIEQYRNKLDLDSGEGKRQFSDVLLPVVKKLSDPVEQDHYLSKIAELCEVSVDSLRSKLSGFSKEPEHKLCKPAVTLSISKEQVELIRSEQSLLAILLQRPEFLENIRLIKGDMLSPEADSLWQKLSQGTKVNMKNKAEYVKMLGLEYEELYQELDDLELRSEVVQLESRFIRQYVKNKKTEIILELGGADGKTHDQLMRKIKNLDQLLSKIKGESY
jgi:DNA primase